jgi:lipopolysaccharide/colanic/teichoic acid biosynthesis glycosyltransferase
MSEADREEFRGFYMAFGKRCLDVTLAVLGLAILFLPMLIIAVAVQLTMGSPVFFVQKRIGRAGRSFYLIKFRTMLPGSELGGSVTLRSDPRTTPFGRFLRSKKLDELPQFWNVLRGDMSFVGPRPDVPGNADELTGDARRILTLRPGITGPASLRFANEELLLDGVSDAETYNRQVIFPEKVRINLRYADELTLLGDLRILLKTLWLWVGPRGH